jgi:superfamily II DNA or RNA helicase
MSFWDWCSATPEIAEIDLVHSAISLWETLFKRAPGKEELKRMLSSIIDVDEVLNDALLRSSVLASIPREMQNIGYIPKALELHHSIGGRTPSRDQLGLIRRYLGLSSADGNAVVTRRQLSSTVPAEYGLFRHQQDIMLKALDLLQDRTKRLVVHMPTGTGKTRTAMCLVSLWLNQKRGAVGWATYSRELIEQAKQEFEKSWSFHGMYEASLGYFTTESESAIDLEDIDFVFASLSMLGRARDRKDPPILKILAQKISLLIIDEAHQALADTWGEAIDLLTSLNQELRIIGLTATPGRATEAEHASNIEMSAFFNHYKVQLEVPGYSSPIDYLLEQGYLAQPCYRNIPMDNSTFETRLLSTIQAILTVIDEGHKRIIVFTETVHSSQLCAAVLNAMNLRCFSVCSDTSDEQRNLAYSKYRDVSPRPTILVNYGVLTTGFDAPLTSAVIIARPISSLVQYSQIVGRALRGPRASGTKYATIYNLYSSDEQAFKDLILAFSKWNSQWSNS